MLLTLKRGPSSAKATIGSLAVDGVYECLTLEDVVRDIKIQNETAIPAGTYEVKITFSNRFKRLMPLLVGVKGFEGVRIHCGNTAADTDGCILVGLTKVNDDFISGSRIAFERLWPRLLEACQVGQVWIEVKDVSI